MSSGMLCLKLTDFIEVNKYQAKDIYERDEPLGFIAHNLAEMRPILIVDHVLKRWNNK